ncbi:hypothetical protein EJ08DRAFT_102665 [Tothia fuscella]|uniref:DUF7918 domain-containing protein n=1 Tax=Tothia fuscella TaxID=1048955 RepID=A0A9P4TZX1_9PEZI|nr:hypothetical protein EJ08DRAFT_102665 [Tothia fuscella]
MPSNGLLSCAIELGNSNLRLREYGTTYEDRTVETYVAIPTQRTPFGIRLNSYGYISPGLSVYVFIDGVYQTNRNKRGIIPPSIDEPDAANVQFRVGQKEDLLRDGRVIARGWWFEKLNIVGAETKASIGDNVLNNIGTIEVIVLRCEDDPSNPNINPWDFPRLPSLSKNENQNDRRGSQSKNNKSNSKRSPNHGGNDDGDDDVGGFFGIFDGAGDDPRQDRLYLHERYNTRQPSPRPNRHAYQYVRGREFLSRRASSPHPRLLEDDDDMPTCTDTRTTHEDESPPRRRVALRGGYGDLSPPSYHTRDPRTSDYYRDAWEANRRHASLPREEVLPSLRKPSIPHLPVEYIPPPHRAIQPRPSPERSYSRSKLLEEEELRAKRLKEQNLREERELESKREKTRALDKELKYMSRVKRTSLDAERFRRDEAYDATLRRRDAWDRASPPSPHLYEYSGGASQDEASRRHAAPTPRALRAPSDPKVAGTQAQQQQRPPLPLPLPLPLPPLAAGPWLPFGPPINSLPPVQNHTVPVTYPPPATGWAGTVPPLNSSVPPAQPGQPPLHWQAHRQAPPHSGYQANPAGPNTQFAPHVQVYPPNLGPNPMPHGTNPPQYQSPPQYQGPPQFQGPPQHQGPMQNSQPPPGFLPHQPMNQHSSHPAQPDLAWKVQQLENKLEQLKVRSGPDEQRVSSWNPGVPQRQGSGGRNNNNQRQGSGWANNNDQRQDSSGWANGNDQQRHTSDSWGKNDNQDGAGGWASNSNNGNTTPTGPGGAGDWASDNNNGNTTPTGPSGWTDNKGDSGGEGWSKTDNNNHNSNNNNKNKSDAQQNDNNWGSSGNNQNQNDGGRNNSSSNNNQKGDSGWDIPNTNTNNQQKTDDNWGKAASNQQDNNQDTNDPSWDNKSQQSQHNSVAKDDWANNNQNNDSSNNNNNNNNGGGNDWANNTANNANNNDNSGWNNNDSSSKPKSKKSSSKGKAKSEDSPPAEAPYTRSYWMDQGADMYESNSSKRRHTIPEEPIYTIPESKAKKAHIRHQVRPGKGAEHTKRTYKPYYWDTFEKPYAVFRFKYRSRYMLKEILDQEIKESPEEFKERLGVLSKDELIAEMLRKRVRFVPRVDFATPIAAYYFFNPLSPTFLPLYHTGWW